MVTCQSANQLKTHLQRFLSLQNGLSVWFTRLHNHGKTADLTVVQKTIIDTLHKEDKPQTSLFKKLAVHRVLYPSMLTESWVEIKMHSQPTNFLLVLWSILICWDSEIGGFCDPNPNHHIKRTKDLNYFSRVHWIYLIQWVSQFELNYWNNWTFPWHSNLLRCTCTFMRCVIYCVCCSHGTAAKFLDYYAEWEYSYLPYRPRKSQLFIFHLSYYIM